MSRSGILCKPLIICLQLFIAHPIDFLLLLPGEFLSHRLVHLDDAQGLGMAEHLHILETLEGVGQDIPLGLLVSVAALGEDAVFLFHRQSGGAAALISKT